MLARLRKAKDENEGGFTLIELLVVVIIIGILAAIAIPTFLSQREKAWAKSAQSDLRNAAVVLEEYYSEPTTATPPGGGGSYAAFDVATVKTSDSVTLSLVSGDENGYCMQSVHSSLPTGEDTFHLDSADGVVAEGTC